MSEISVIAGPASPDLAAKIAKHLDAQLVAAELRIFSDGESKIKIGRTSRNCIIVQSTYPPTDTHILQILMMAKKCAENGAHKICAVVPYLAYARQDRAFLEDEVVSIALIAKLLQATGIDHLITVDIHSQLAMSHFAPIDIENISSIPLLADFATSKLKLQNAVAVSPDSGGAQRAREFANYLSIDTIALKKSRDRNTGEVSVNEKLDIDITDRDVILIDDMISSGGSIIKAARLLNKKGANRIYAMCAHALLIDDAAHKIQARGIQDIIATNSIPGEYARVDLSPVIAKVLKPRYSAS
ncbi:MAG TPA: ribose-phosphate pyrophosphokinase [Nitrososphaera sp.]|nr:ribose-phosphate pyrophosphokinase [Nitrososphaera sp.]